ncbi:SulP family inorganic anion transporter [Tepidimonas charontis]|nr:SulP family inorganic anion transporter [Tepidimonas charontis]
MLAGFQVALLWTPFSLGVALASGAPAVAGLISAIVAGLLYPFLGGSYVTVSGPAAALAPVLLWGMLTLGHGDLAAGYPLVLVAVVFTGILQLVLAALKAGRYTSLLPVTVVEAMLAAIGIMIIVRQLPALVGAPSAPAKSVLEALTQLPTQLAQAQVVPLAIGVGGLLLLFALRRPKQAMWRWIPPAIVVAALGGLVGWLAELPAGFRIAMPEQLIDGIVFPDFAGWLQSPDLWLPMLMVVLTFTMIDGVESVASVKAVDKIDPWRRQSDANKTLRAMGVCNVASGMLGGLTVIPNAVPSRANIDAGARTLWSNLYSGVFLLVFALALPSLLTLIPLAAIASILIYIGWRLCEPAVFVRIAAIGRDRLLVFTATVIAILLTDLLKGMFIGVAIELVLLLYLQTPSLRWIITGRMTFKDAMQLYRQTIVGMFRNPVIKHRIERVVDAPTDAGAAPHHVFTLGSLLGFNTLRLQEEIAGVPPAHPTVLRFTESAKLIDHSAMEFLQHTEEEYAAEGRPFEVQGLEHFHPFSAHPLATRLQEPGSKWREVVLDERARTMAGLAEALGLSFDASVRVTVNRDGFVYLRRGDQREERNTISGNYQGVTVRVLDYEHTSPPDYYVAHRHTLLFFDWPDAAAPPGVQVLAPGHYLERYLVGLTEVENKESLPSGHRLYAEEGAADDGFVIFGARMVAAVGELYIEYRRGRVLLFAPGRAWESPVRIQAMLRALRQALVP